MVNIVKSGTTLRSAIDSWNDIERVNRELINEQIELFKKTHNELYSHREYTGRTEHRFFSGRLVIVRYHSNRLYAHLKNPFASEQENQQETSTLDWPIIERHLQNVFVEFVRKHLAAATIVQRLAQEKPGYNQCLEPYIDRDRLAGRALSVIHQLYAKHPDYPQARFNQILETEILDPRIHYIAQNISPRPYDLRACNYIAKNPTVEQLADQNPALLPIWYQLSRHTVYVCQRQRHLSEAATLRAYLVDHCRIPRKAWQKLHTLDPEIIRLLSEMSLNELCFCLTRFSKIAYWPSVPVLSFLINAGFFTNYMRVYEDSRMSSRHKQHDSLLKIILIETASQRPKPDVCFSFRILGFVHSYFSQKTIFNNNQLTAGFEQVEQLIRDGARPYPSSEPVIAARRKSPMETQWDPGLEAFEMDGYQVIPLVCRADLKDEATTMSHCVHGYTGDCQNGISRIFSIRKNGQRLATLELRIARDEHIWQISQIKGPHNKRVSGRLTRIGQITRTLMNRQSQTDGPQDSLPF